MVAACIPHLRAADIFARVGGEEFCFMLPGCGAENACERAEELRKAIGRMSENGGSKISASFGVTGTTLSGYELHQLLAHADTALYQAKRAGRDRVVVYDKDSIVTPIRASSQQSAP
jgi:diguanylate cyclase (GGDEF)-like protein